MIKEFKKFIFRGNVVDLAVAVVIGAAFTAVVNSLVKDMFTPLISAVFGKPDFSNLTFTLNKSVFYYGNFLNALIVFLSVSTVVFFFIVQPINRLQKLGFGARPKPEKECPECLSKVPKAAKKCMYCTSALK
jgi:large conductance mechanosensitive channel